MAIYLGISRADYDALGGWNWSSLKAGIDRTFAHISTARKSWTDSAAMKFGRYLHHRILEPELAETWDVLPKVKTTTKDGCVTEHDRATADAMLSNLGGLVEVLRDGDNEFALTWVDRDSGVACKCLVDSFGRDRMVRDYKTAQDASPAEFGKAAARLRYHCQMAFYLDGCQANDLDPVGCELVAQEKAPPFAWGVYPLTDEHLDEGRKVYRRQLDMVTRGDTPANYGRHELDLPAWAYDETEALDLSGADVVEVNHV